MCTESLFNSLPSSFTIVYTLRKPIMAPPRTPPPWPTIAASAIIALLAYFAVKLIQHRRSYRDLVRTYFTLTSPNTLILLSRSPPTTSSGAISN